MTEIQKNLENLRHEMKKESVAAYIIPSEDPHQSEYVPEFWQRRGFISGFTGSTGIVVVTQEKALLWTDFRYYLQAEAELKESEFILMRQGMPDVLSFDRWLLQNMQSGETVAVDPEVLSINKYISVRDFLASGGINLKIIKDNLVDRIWLSRPEAPSNPIKLHPMQFSGEEFREKLKRLRENMVNINAELHVMTLLDSIAWFFNFRGSDVQYNPVFLAFAIITLDEAYLFASQKKIERSAIESLGDVVKFMPYEDFYTVFQKLARDKKLWLDSQNCNYRLQQLCEGSTIIFQPSSIALDKAIKNVTEIEGMRNAHTRDGVALVKFLKWLYEEVPKGGVTEISAARQLSIFREQGEHYQGSSFETISAYKSNAAIVHYRVTEKSNLSLMNEGLYLVDSGAQYLDGTTDVTRTIALGEPSVTQTECFTRVLKGHIKFFRTPFPSGTSGAQLDLLGRIHLWEVGLNYGHGTGHGVGCYLNVHEGPHSINFSRGQTTSLVPGMVCSNEPGFYKPGQFGMRFENLMLVIPFANKNSNELPFFTWSCLTMCPIDLQLVDIKLLDSYEIHWINDYHQKIKDTLGHLLSQEERDWLDNYAKRLPD
ncbi:aminopeptidase P family protein [Candidatus Riflebacteria bacterium]